MMNTTDEKLLRYLDGSLPDDEASGLRARLDSEPDLRNRIDEINSIRNALADSKPDSFAPYFSDRVMRSLGGKDPVAVDSLYDSLRWVFVRAAIACLLIAVALGTYNVLNYQDLDVSGSLIETLFGLPSAELADALDYGAL